jgi:hypothetical protein
MMLLTRRCALLLCGLLLAACTAAEDEPAPVPPRSWTVELSTAPTLLALTGEQVYAASYGNGVGGSQVYRVERATGRKVAQRTLAGQPQAMALSPAGELWLATLKLPDQPGGTGLQVLDPQTLATRRAVQVEGVPLSLAFLGDALWVGDEDGLRQLAPRSGRVLQRVVTGVAATRLLALGDALVVVGPEGLQRVAASGRIGPVRRLTAAGSVTATGDTEHLWVVHPDGRAAAVLAAFDPRTLAPRATAGSPGQAGAGAHLGPDALWVTDPGGQRLLCLDPVTGRVRGERALQPTGPLVADGETVVVAQAQGLAAVPADCRAAD